MPNYYIYCICVYVYIYSFSLNHFFWVNHYWTNVLADMNYVPLRRKMLKHIFIDKTLKGFFL